MIINGWTILAILFLVCAVVFSILFSRKEKLVFAVLTYSSILVMVLSIIISIVGPLVAKKNILYHKSLTLAVNTAGPIVGYEEFAESVEKSNKWFNNANDNLNTFGVFSMYYGSELEELELIVIPNDN